MAGGGFGVGFRLISVGVWLAVRCGVGFGVGLGGWQWWFPFLVDSGGFGCVFFFLFCFTLLQTHNVNYFPSIFLECKQILEKQSFSLKSFTFANILRLKMFYVETNEASTHLATRFVLISI